jgi:hypothetical protein
MTPARLEHLALLAREAAAWAAATGESEPAAVLEDAATSAEALAVRDRAELAGIEGPA